MSIKEQFLTCIQGGARDLDISGLELTACPKQVEENPKLRELVRINLGFNKIRTFPNFMQLSRLAILHLGGNLLTSVESRSFSSLLKLRELTLYGNSLTSLPESIGNFTKLEKLDVSNNRLQRLPNEIGYLCSLVELKCSGNPLQEIPRPIRDCGHLESANFDFCQLTTVCSESLAKNKLRQLPPDMGIHHARVVLAQLRALAGRMTRLTNLNVTDNQLTDLPISMGLCASIGQLGSGVSLEGNPIQNSALLKARAIGPDHLLFFLEKRLDAVPGKFPPLREIPWHGLLERRATASKQSKTDGISINLGNFGVSSGASATSSQRLAKQKSDNAAARQKVDTLKRWGNEQINNVFIPKLRQIRQAVDAMQTVEQGAKLLQFMKVRLSVVLRCADVARCISQRVGPALQAVSDQLPDQEPLPPPNIAPGLPPITVMRAHLEHACLSAKRILEACQILLSSTSYAETIVDLVKALKGVSQYIS